MYIISFSCIIKTINYMKSPSGRINKKYCIVFTSLIIIKHVFIWTSLQSQYRLVYCPSFPHLTKPLNPSYHLVQLPITLRV